MLTKEHFEKAARRYCKLMGIDPDEIAANSVSDSGEEETHTNADLLVHAGRSHVAWQCAFQDVLGDVQEAASQANTSSNRLRNIITP